MNRIEAETTASYDLYLPDINASRRATCSPRVILLTSDHRFPVVPYGQTGWLGLPGGKVRTDEIDGNLMSTGAFPCLDREVKEETGIDISRFLASQSACLGLVDITIVDEERRQLTNMVNPIFLCKVPDLTGLIDNVMLYSLHQAPGPLFPDARIAVSYLAKSLTERKKGQILPEFLNQEAIYFSMKPGPHILMGLPAWAR